MSVHAHGMNAMNMQPADPVAAEPAATHDAHCADHAAIDHASTMNDVSMEMPMHMSMDGHADMAMAEDEIPQNVAADVDCCQSMLCKCPCIQALALIPSLPYVPTTLPAAQSAPVIVISLPHAGISGVFRPPIQVI